MYSWNIYYEEKKWRKLYAIIKQELTRMEKDLRWCIQPPEIFFAYGCPRRFF